MDNILEGHSLDFTPVDEKERNIEQMVRPSVRYWPEVWKRLFHNKIAVLCIGILAAIILLAVFAPVFSGYEYDASNLSESNLAPGGSHIMGTDELGRDLWTRIWVGARASLLIGFLGALAPFLIGTVIGAIAGWYGGWIDMLVMRICDIMICIPSMIYMILILMVMGGSIQSMVVAMAICGWMTAARSFRGRILQFKNHEFTLAARTQGASGRRIVFRHILPNILGNIAVGLSGSIPGAIFMEAGMSYIGLGVTPPNVSLGQLSTEGTKCFLVASKFHQFLFPAIVISLMIFAFFMFGNCLRDALDPKIRDEEYNMKRMRKMKRQLRKTRYSGKAVS